MAATNSYKVALKQGSFDRKRLIARAGANIRLLGLNNDFLQLSADLVAMLSHLAPTKFSFILSAFILRLRRNFDTLEEFWRTDWSLMHRKASCKTQSVTKYLRSQPTNQFRFSFFLREQSKPLCLSSELHCISLR